MGREAERLLSGGRREGSSYADQYEIHFSVLLYIYRRHTVDTVISLAGSETLHRGISTCPDHKYSVQPIFGESHATTGYRIINTEIWPVFCAHRDTERVSYGYMVQN